MPQRHPSLTGTPLPPLEAGSPEWLKTMSASKIAAVVGHSPYESRFSLWHRMAGLVPPEADSDIFRRGHYLEPAIAAWFADQHPELTVLGAESWAHREHRWATATPDRHLAAPDAPVHALLECKSASDTDEWGRPGTDEIPRGYHDQVQWQMGVTGAHVCYVAVLSAFLRFDEYAVEFNPGHFDYLLRKAQEFMDSLPGGPAEQRPDVDEHASTYEAIRELHPEIDLDDTEIDPTLRDRYRTAIDAHKAAEAEKRFATSLVADAIGTNRRATCLVLQLRLF